VPKKFAFDQRVGQRRAIDSDKRHGRAAAARVDFARHQLLPGAALALNQDRDIGGSHTFDDFEHLLHGRTGADHGLEAAVATQLRPQRLVLNSELGSLPGITYQETQLVHLERLGEILVGPGTNGFNRQPLRSVSCDNNDRRRTGTRGEFLQQIDARAVRQVYIEQDEVGILLLEYESPGT